MRSTSTEALIAIGSNIDAEGNIPRALAVLANRTTILAVSEFYCSEAVGGEPQSPFINGACRISTELPPRSLKFDVLREIERQLGRVRTADKYAPREIDLDIALYGNVSVHENGLVIPDPDIPTRPFLSVPLAELAPEWPVPGLHATLMEIAAATDARQLTPAGELSRRLKEMFPK